MNIGENNDMGGNMINRKINNIIPDKDDIIKGDIIKDKILEDETPTIDKIYKIILSVNPDCANDFIILPNKEKSKIGNKTLEYICELVRKSKKKSNNLPKKSRINNYKLFQYQDSKPQIPTSTPEVSPQDVDALRYAAVDQMGFLNKKFGNFPQEVSSSAENTVKNKIGGGKRKKHSKKKKKSKKKKGKSKRQRGGRKCNKEEECWCAQKKNASEAVENYKDDNGHCYQCPKEYPVGNCRSPNYYR